MQAIGLFVLCSAPCIWYFNGGNSQLHAPITRSLYRAFRYHLGSLAFGSFILAIVQLIRLILEYITQQAKQSGLDQSNKMVKYLLDCLRCYAACFQRFVEFLNRNAYIQIALSGENFCTSAKNAFVQMVKNPARFALVNGIGGIFVLFGKLFVLVATVALCYIILIDANPYKSKIDNPLFPLIIIGIIVYGVS